MEKAKVGIVGTGHGLRTILPALQSTDHFEVCAVSGSSKERAKLHVKDLKEDIEVAEFYEILDMANELDLLCIASPNEFHLEQFCASAAVATNIYLEKPIGNNYADALAIQNSYSDFPSEKFLVVGHQLRFNPYVREIRKQWQEEIIGRVYSVSIHQRGGAFASEDRQWTWEFEKAKGGGVRLAMGTHLIDLVCYLSGTNLNNVCVNMDAVHNRRTPIGEKESLSVTACNSFSASIDGGNFEAMVSTSAASHGPGRFEIEVLGTKGALYYDGVSALKSYSEGRLNPRLISEKVEADYLDQPGNSIFRKSLCEMAQEMAASIMGNENRLSDAATISDSINLMKHLDMGMKFRNDRFDDRPSMY